MEDPVMTHDGHTYERAAIQHWFDIGRRTSPNTNTRLISTELRPNHAMRKLIQDLKAQIPALARHRLDMRTIEAAIKLREEEIQQEFELKGNLLQQEQQKVARLEAQLAEAKKINQVVNEIRPSEVIIFCGNPGVGKTTLCNTIFQQAIFNSGISFGKGLTTNKQEHTHENRLYIDTPGLDDIEMRKDAALEIEKALKHNNNYKIVFVAMLDQGRIRPADLVTINTICDAIKTDFEYGIVFNQVSRKIIREIEAKGLNQENLGDYLTMLHKKPALTVVLKRDEDLDGEKNVYFQGSDENRENLLRFIAKLKANRIEESNVNRLDIKNFEEKINEMEVIYKKKISELQATIEEQQEEIRKLRDGTCLLF